MTPSTTPVSQHDAWQAWERLARAQLVRAMAARQVGYKELARALEREGICESAGQLNRKVNRGKFSAAFWLACMHALDVRVQQTLEGD